MRGLLALLGVLPSSAQAETIHIWGHPAFAPIAHRWAAAWQQQHPDVQFQFIMRGSNSAIHGLVSSAADIALMGRENDVVDDNGFSRPKQYPVTRIAIARQGLNNSIALLVHRTNPLQALSMSQLARVLDCSDQANRARTWGDIGLTGTWAKAPIRVHSFDLGSRTGIWLQDQIMGKSRRMCWDHIREYHAATRAEAADRTGKAAAQDRFALALANRAQARRGLKVLALDQPLRRTAYAFVDWPRGGAIKPQVLAFLRFALSAKGQALVAQDSHFAPLDPELAQAQLATLEGK